MNFSHPHFAEPRWLWMAFLAPVILFALQRYSDWARKRQLARFAAPEFLERLTSSHSPWRRTLKQVLLLLGVAGIGMALARPQWGEQAETSQALGQDVVFLLDCSRSEFTAKTTGAETSTMTINSNSSTNSVATINLSGTGL